MSKLKNILNLGHAGEPKVLEQARKKSPARAKGNADDGWIEPPVNFSESEFFNYARALVDQGNAEQALHYFLKALPDFADSGMNPKEKLNHLMFLSRMVQNNGSAKHGYHKLLRKVQSLDNELGNIKLPPGGTFVELGCGAHDPLALASYCFWNGFSPCYGIDLLPPRNDVYSALSMYDILANARSFPLRYRRKNVELRDFLSRLRRFDMAAFERGDFAGGFSPVADQIRHETKNLLESSIEPGSVSFLTSFAVLEHVSDIDAISRQLFALMAPGGLVFHFVDLVDHRSYRHDPTFNAFSFLTEAQAPPGVNRLRAPQITEAHRQAGFELLKDTRNKIVVPDQVRNNLQPQFRGMSLDEIGTVKQSLILRKPLN
jgi:hypothetical protein